MALTKEQRDALPEDDFAVPETRQLPMHDAKHTKLAWDMVENTKGLSDEQKKRARSRILKRAHELGINTDNWNQLKGMRFEAMAIELPEVKDHPNKVPFSGILTRVDEPSDNPLGGSHGKRVILPKAAAEKALSSLLGMAIDFTPKLDGHDARNKIGLITEANIVGNAIHISGFFYGADFPVEVKNIQANKSQLGFSYEAQARVRSLDDDPLIVESCVFTGAAVLYKDCAAYTTTSLTAKADMEQKMNEELLKLIAGIQERLDSIEKAQNEAKEAAKESAKLQAGSIGHIIKPHAERLRAAADAMEQSGIGMHASRGHVAVLRGMADSMEAEAAMGKTPHIYHSNDYLSANADKDKGESKGESKEMADIKAMFETLTTKVTDLEKARFEAAASPERKTLDPAVMSLLAKAGLKPGDGEKMTVAQVDKALEAAGVQRHQSIAVKVAMQDAGLLATNSH